MLSYKVISRVRLVRWHYPDAAADCRVGQGHRHRSLCEFLKNVCDRFV